jgi:hypothetical protein
MFDRAGDSLARSAEPITAGAVKAGKALVSVLSDGALFPEAVPDAIRGLSRSRWEDATQIDDPKTKRLPQSRIQHHERHVSASPVAAADRSEDGPAMDPRTWADNPARGKEIGDPLIDLDGLETRTVDRAGVDVLQYFESGLGSSSGWFDVPVVDEFHDTGDTGAELLKRFGRNPYDSPTTARRAE